KNCDPIPTIFAWHGRNYSRGLILKAARKTASPIPAMAEKIFAAINEQSLVTMCCDVINIPSPTGHEGRMADYMRSAWESMGLQVTWKEVEEGRANMIARWQGGVNGQALMSNGDVDHATYGE